MMKEEYRKLKRRSAVLLSLMLAMASVPADVYAAAVSEDGIFEEEIFADELSAVPGPGVSGPEVNEAEDVPDDATPTYKPYEDATYKLKYEELEDGTLRITGFTGESSGRLVIPDSIDGKKVTEIGNGAFSNYDGNRNYLSTLDSPYGLEHIGFTGSLKIPGGVRVIGDNAFLCCVGLSGDLRIPDSVTTIGEYAFSNCKGFTGDLIIGDGVTSIGDYAFNICPGFTGDLTIGERVRTIGNHAFFFCRGFTGDLIIGNSVETIGESAFYRCDGFTGSLTIGNSVETIGECAFYGCEGFTGSLTIGNSVETIGDYAFRGCSGFTGSLTIGNSVETIGNYAFYCCDGFTGSLTLGNSVETIGGSAFSYCPGFTSLTIGSGVKAARSNSFGGCRSLREIVIEETVESEVSLNDPFSGCPNIRKVVNRSGIEFPLPDPGGKTWFNAATGEEITSGRIANGTAIRSDFYDPVNIPCFTHSAVGSVTYTGKAVKPAVDVYFREGLLQEKKDYTLRYTDNINVGTATFTITGKGSYAGKDSDSFEILEKDIADDDVVVTPPAAAAYTGKEQRPVPKITYNGILLKNGRDFRISYYGDEGCREYCIPKAPHTYFLKIKGIGNFKGERTSSFTIAKSTQVPVGRLTVGRIPSAAYTGEQIRPEPVVKYGNRVLAKDTDYTLSYGGNTDIGTGTVSITGSGPYTGTRTLTFRITGIPMNKVTVSGLQTAVYDGTAKTPGTGLAYKPGKRAASVAVKGVTRETYDAMSEDEKKTVDCIISYGVNTEAGIGTVILEGIHGGSGSAKKTFRIAPYDMGKKPDERITVSLNGAGYPYVKGGTRPKPSVDFKKADGSVVSLMEGRDYTLSYQYNTAVNDGTGKKKPVVKIKGKGNFKGYISKTFVITQADMAETGVTVMAGDVIYQNRPGKWKAKIRVAGPDGKALKPGTDYESRISYTYAEGPDEGKQVSSNAIPDAGTLIRVTVTGKGRSYRGTATGVYRIVRQDIGKLKAVIASRTYTGEAVEISNDDIRWKKDGKNITDVTFRIDEGSYRNNTDASTKKTRASVKVYGTGNYGGSTTVTFRIKPRSILWWWKELMGD